MHPNYSEQMAEHLMHMHKFFGWPHPGDYSKIRADLKTVTEGFNKACEGLNDLYSDETITATVEDLVKQHALVSPEDAADLRAWVNG